MSSPRRLLAVALVATAGAGVLTALPASAHNPRNTPADAPRMDLEVMVTPEIQGRITPGGTDPVVAVDGFGNRFVLARKEDAQTLVGVDQRARLAARAAPWSWTSSDDGLTWQNVDTLPRGAEQLLPQGLARDVAANGPVTAFAENRGTAVVVQRLTALGKGRLGPVTTSLVPTGLPGGAAGDVAVATTGADTVLALASAGGTRVTRIAAADGVDADGTSLPGRCDVAADPRAARATFWAACSDGALHRSTDGGATFAKAGAVRSSGDERPAVDVGPDGTPYVLTGTTLSRLRAGRVLSQDLALPRGDRSGTAFAVSNRGRIAASTYTRATPGAGWHVQVALFTPGTKPVWYDFSDHDPATPNGAGTPPSRATSVDTDPQGRLQLVWATTFLQGEALDRPLLRNVFTARSVTR